MPKSHACCLCSSTTASLDAVLEPLLERIQGDPVTVIVNRRSVLRSVQFTMNRADFNFWRPPQEQTTMCRCNS